jgi:large subunit ribosomal protein L29
VKYQEIKGLAVEDIQKKITETRGVLLQAKLNNNLGRQANPIEIRNLRRSIAQMKTALAVSGSMK